MTTAAMQLTDDDVLSERLDQPPSAEAPRKVFICSSPRSGSTMLCRVMINAGLGVPYEYFNPVYVRPLAARLGIAGVDAIEWKGRGRVRRYIARRLGRDPRPIFMSAYIDEIVRRRCRNGVFAAKIQFWQYRRLLNSDPGRRLLNDGVFIHLYREDLLAQAVSVHFAHLTGQWGSDASTATRPAVNPDFFDAALVRKALEGMADEDRGWRVFFAENAIRPITLSYEELCKDPYSLVLRITDRLGIDPGCLRRNLPESDRYAEAAPGLPKKSEVARRFLAAARKIQDMAPPATPAV